MLETAHRWPVFWLAGDREKPLALLPPCALESRMPDWVFILVSVLSALVMAFVLSEVLTRGRRRR